MRSIGITFAAGLLLESSTSASARIVAPSPPGIAVADCGLKLDNDPTLSYLDLLSDEEFFEQHERVKAELGDETYVALRRLEIQEKSGKIANYIITKCPFSTPVDNNYIGDKRLVTADGRQFRVGQGVPEEHAYALSALFEGVDDGSFPSLVIPAELLKYEVPKEQIEREEAEQRVTA